MQGDTDHEEPYPGDHGIRYEPLDRSALKAQSG
jgi:hypothetical protein